MSLKNDRLVVEVDKRGRIPLGKFGIKDMTVVVEKLPEGKGVTVQPAVVLTEAEAAHYANQRAVASLDRAIAQAEAGDIRPGKLRTR